ncbi:MAG: DEAD/DEAH box helicase, partial [Flavobacteriales bacterium]
MSTVKTSETEDRKSGKDLYSYQKGAIDKIFKCFEEAPDDYHLLYQLPTGGGKTV